MTFSFNSRTRAKLAASGCLRLLIALVAIVAASTQAKVATAQYQGNLLFGGPMQPMQTPAAWQFNYRPLQYFQAFDGGDSIINSYLLSYLSNAIYADGIGVDPDWEDQFKSEMTGLGAVRADFYGNTSTGAEVGTVETTDALIIVHRGSHPNGTPLNLIAADWIHDINDDAVRKTIGGLSMYVHEGFWQTQNSVFWWVYWKARDAHNRGKRIWVTGHSLGGANATITAARLHYDLGIPVQGLQTFGSLKVGDSDFKKLFTFAGAGNRVLEPRVRRWAVEGDKATTLFVKDRVWKTNSWGYFTVYYEHVGQTNHIFQTNNGSGYDFDVAYDSADRSSIMFAPTWSILPGGAHGMYTDALEAEMTRVLTQQNRLSTLLDILDG